LTFYIAAIFLDSGLVVQHQGGTAQWQLWPWWRKTQQCEQQQSHISACMLFPLWWNCGVVAIGGIEPWTVPWREGAPSWSVQRLAP